MRDSKNYTMLSAGKARTITSTTDATPIVVTLATHGYSTGDVVTIMAHTTNTNANGTWVVTKVNANSFSLDGSTATGGGAGGAAGTLALASKVIDVQDFKHAVLSIDTDGGGDAAFTWKIAGAISEAIPDFADAQSTTNRYDYIDVIDLEDNASIDGDTGFVVAGADDHRLLQANVDGLKWLTIVCTAGTEGELTVEARLFTDD